MPRSPGSLVRARCCICGTVETARSASNFSRCSACKAAGRWSKYHNLGTRLGASGAQAVVQRAMRDGLLPRPHGLRCADCGRPATEYEHRDYNKPLEVEPICRTCNLKRGPALPLEGCLHPLVAAGYTPYRHRKGAIQVFRMLGLDPAPLDKYPGFLTHEHWRELIAFVPAVGGA